MIWLIILQYQEVPSRQQDKLHKVAIFQTFDLTNVHFPITIYYFHTCMKIQWSKDSITYGNTMSFLQFCYRVATSLSCFFSFQDQVSMLHRAPIHLFLNDISSLISNSHAEIFCLVHCVIIFVCGWYWVHKIR